MTDCLRCGPAVVDLGNWLIAQEEDRIPKELNSVTDWDADVTLVRFDDHLDEGRSVGRIIASEIGSGVPPEEVLVVLKSDSGGRVSAAIKQTLGEYEIECYLPRASFDLPLDAQRLLEYLKLSESLRAGIADPLSVRALLELESNGIGATRIRAVLNHALDAGVNFLDSVEHFRERPEDYPTTGVDALLESLDFILNAANDLQHHPGEDFDAWVGRVAHQLELDPDAVELIAAGAEQVLLSLKDIEGGIDMAPINYVEELSAAVTGLEDTKPAKLEGHVTITSMHGAKGLSADVVFVLQAEDEVIPDATVGAEYKESRRLLYVSITRARKRLYVGFCGSRGDGQEWVRNKRYWNRTLTRFLRGYGLEAISSATLVGD
jgi:DNA helicase-2/ATP-dependent DNA helicase PcrA